MSGRMGLPARGSSAASRLGATFARLGRTLRAGMVRLLDLPWEWRRRRYERLLLASLGTRALADLGLSRADVAMEVEKPFWRG